MVDDTSQEIQKLHKEWVKSAVDENLDTLDFKYSDFKLEQMKTYINTTESMIFDSFMKRGNFKFKNLC